MLSLLEDDKKRADVSDVLKRADIDGDGVVNYHELAHTYVQRKILANEERMFSTFEMLDKDQNGLITVDDLMAAFPDETKEHATVLLAFFLFIIIFFLILYPLNIHFSLPYLIFIYFCGVGFKL